MILAEQLMKAIHNAMGSATRVTGAWPFVAPDEATYPFATYSVVSEIQESTFNTDMGAIQVQFSVFDDNPSPSDTVRALCEIEAMFDRRTISIPCTAVIFVCSHKTTNGVKYLDQDHYWQGTATYEMTLSKPKNDDLDSSSSESSSP